MDSTPSKPPTPEEPAPIGAGEPERAQLAERLTAFALERRITIFVLFLSLVVVGLVAALGIPIELFPRGYVGSSLHVSVPWPDAPPREVLEKITMPLEEELSTVRGLNRINSNTRRGGAYVFLNFKSGTDMSVAYRETRDRVERARLLFPDDVERTFIYKEDASGIPVMVIGVIVDPGLIDYYDLIQNEVIRPLSRIDGVATVRADGLEQKEVLIEVDKEKSDSLGLNLFELAQSLRGDNFTLASGTVQSADKKYLLRSVATYTSLSDIENRSLTPKVRLKDVAVVRYAEPERRYRVRVNSSQALAVVVVKEGEANAVDLSRRLQERVDAMAEDPRLSGLEMKAFMNQGKLVTESIGTLVAGGRLGGVLAALVLFLFLRRFRLTAIITLSIPLSMLCALIVMFFLGETLNILSILGLVICVGLLIDNSVVIAENIHRHHRDGASRRDACLHGAGEIALAITMATLTTIIVFLPVALVEGQGQFFLLRLALPISVSLFASLLIALIFIPLSVYLTLPTGRKASDSAFNRFHTRTNNVLRTIYENTFERANRSTQRALGWALSNRLEVVVILIFLFAATRVATKEVEFVEMQEEDRQSVQVYFDLSDEYSFEDSEAFFMEIEAILESKREDYGMEGYLVFFRQGGGRFECWLRPDREPRRPAAEITEELLALLPEKPGVKRFYRQQNQAKEERSRDVHSIQLEGDDAGILEEVATALEPLFSQIDGVLGVREANEPEPSEIGIVIDRDRATANQVNPEMLAGAIGYALRGQALPRFSYDGRQIPVRVRFEEEDRKGLWKLMNMQIPTGTGGFLPVSALADSRRLSNESNISRRNKRITRTITLDLKPEVAKEARERIETRKRQIDLPEGVSFGAPSGAAAFNEDLANMLFAGSLSIVFIYLLMAFLFESFVLPLSIILTIPLAALGVLWSHFFSGRDIDFLGVVGSILLIGVVVNNGIVLIDYVNRLRHRGYDRNAALLAASQRRFRPIVMTALTTIIGMIPLTFSRPSEMGLSYKSFGMTLIGGMTTATLLTLLVVPVFYTLFDELSVFLRRLFSEIVFGRRRPTGAAPVSRSVQSADE